MENVQIIYHVWPPAKKLQNISNVLLC